MWIAQNGQNANRSRSHLQGCRGLRQSRMPSSQTRSNRDERANNPFEQKGNMQLLSGEGNQASTSIQTKKSIGERITEDEHAAPIRSNK